MKILLLESFYGGSHKIWADQLARIFGEQMILMTLPDRFWKWRMESAGVAFAQRFTDLNETVGSIIVSDMINLPQFIDLSGVDRKRTKINLYMHENQLCYPWKADRTILDKARDKHFGFMNIINSVSADQLVFNSQFHKEAFLQEIPTFLRAFPDQLPMIDLKVIRAKSITLGIPLNLEKITSQLPKNKHNKIPVILWNHRWEHDKNPELLFESLIELKNEGLKFKLNVLGESFRNQPKIFKQAKTMLADEIMHFGFVSDREQYMEIVKRSDILPVTSNHEFFGISVIEAIAAGLTPLLPNRLSYPEHIDPTKYASVYYNTDSEFTEKLKILVSTWPSQRESFVKHVLKYDISMLGPTYREHLL